MRSWRKWGAQEAVLLDLPLVLQQHPVGEGPYRHGKVGTLPLCPPSCRQYHQRYVEGNRNDEADDAEELDLLRREHAKERIARIGVQRLHRAVRERVKDDVELDAEECGPKDLSEG